MTTKYKKGYLVKHPKIDGWGVGVVVEDGNNETVCVSFKNTGKKILSLKYVEPEILSKEPLSDVEIRQFLQKDRIYFDEPFIDIYYDLKFTYPNHLIIIEQGARFKMLEDDALFFQKEYNYKISEHAIDVMGASFATSISSKVFNKLRLHDYHFVIVSELPNKNPSTDKWERKVTEVFG